MSEQAAESTAAVTEATPDSSTADVTPDTSQGAQTPTPEPTKLPVDTKLEALNRARDRGRKAFEATQAPQEPVEAVETATGDASTQEEKPAVAINTAGRKYETKNGRLLPEDEVTETPPTEVADSEGAEAPSTTEAVEGPPDGFVRIDVPEGNPLRAQGRTHFDVPESEERDYRALVNGAARRAEVEDANRRAQEAERRAIELRAAHQFYAEGGGQLTAEDQATYADLKRAWGDEAAEAFKRGKLAEIQQQVQGRQTEAAREYESQMWTTRATQFKAQKSVELHQQFPGISQQTLDTLFAAYGNHLSALFATGQNPQIGEGFSDVARLYLNADPAVRARFDTEVQRRQSEVAEKAKAEALQEAEAAEEARLKEMASRHATRIPAGVVTAQTGARTGEASEQPDRTKMTPRQARNAGAAAARERARAIAGG